MSSKPLSNSFLSAFSLELALLLHSGVTVNDGLHLLLEDEENAAARSVLEPLAKTTDLGEPLSKALEESGLFPGHFTGMVLTGERSGRLEEALRGLSGYYDTRQRMAKQVRSALLYPAILAVLMLAVVAVLIVQVLPSFDKVYQQLGSRLTGLGGGLLKLGQALSAGLPVFLALLALIVIAVGAYFLSPGVKKSVDGWFRKTFGGKGISRKTSAARFASALSMGMQSGLPVEESIDLAASLQNDDPDLQTRAKKCRTLLDDGTPLAQALTQSELFPPAYGRMLALGLRSGAGDEMMAQLALRMEEDAQDALDAAVGRVEPTLVILSSVLVGVVLLSVMLPLMNILSSIG